VTSTLRKLGAYAVLATVGGVLLVVGIYAVNALSAMLVTLAFLVAAGLVAWIVLGRAWDWLRHGKPFFRGGSTSSSSSPSTPEVDGDGAAALAKVLNDGAESTKSDIQEAREYLERNQ
jgi:hypothetical protein